MTLRDIDTPFGLDPAEATRILNESGCTPTDASAERELCQRLDRISECLLGRSYGEGSLGGGPDLPEEFRIYLNAFDCVTFIETVLALSLAQTTYEFVDTLRRIRYEDGEIDWFHRNHYMVDWARNNERCGFINNITFGPFTLKKTSTLNLIAGLPAKSTTFRYFPTKSGAQVVELIESGDLILFVSTKETLDVFHTGVVVVNRGGRLLMRHATRTAGAVIEQDLGEFMSQNEMAGFILLRPLCRQ